MKYRYDDAKQMAGHNPCTSGTQRKLIIPEKETSAGQLMAPGNPSAYLHGRHPQPVAPAYTFHFFPHALHTQYDSEYVCFPSVQKPHKTPTGPARSHPQHPFDAEKSFPSVCVDVMI